MPWTRGVHGVVAGLLLAGCVGSGGPPAASPPAIEALRREVMDLRFELEIHRRQAVQPGEIDGLQAELRAIQTALQALVRDAEQRRLEGDQALERRLSGAERRMTELTAALGRVEAALIDLAPRIERLERPPTVAPAPRAPAPLTPEPARAPAPAAPVPVRPSMIRRVNIGGAGSAEARVSVEADGPLSHRAFTLDDPPRLVVDFDNAVYGFDRAPVSVGGAVLDGVRFIQLRASPTSVVRLVMTLTRPVPHRIEPHPRGLVIHLGPGPSR